MNHLLTVMPQEKHHLWQCNQTVKFRDLFKYAKEMKADALITGHYVESQSNGHASMYRTKDQNRDQSYFYLAQHKNS